MKMLRHVAAHSRASTDRAAPKKRQGRRALSSMSKTLVILPEIYAPSPRRKRGATNARAQLH